jgi:hypothetical protein
MVKLKMTSMKKSLGEFFMENDKKEKTCHGEIYVDFSKYIYAEELCIPCSKENSRTSFFRGCLM